MKKIMFLRCSFIFAMIFTFTAEAAVYEIVGYDGSFRSGSFPGYFDYVFNNGIPDATHPEYGQRVQDNIAFHIDFGQDNDMSDRTGSIDANDMYMADFVYTYQTETPRGDFEYAASGFTEPSNGIGIPTGWGTRPQFALHMWIRNPQSLDGEEAMLWGLNESQTPSNDGHVERFWINADGETVNYSRRRGEGPSAGNNIVNYVENPDDYNDDWWRHENRKFSDIDANFWENDTWYFIGMTHHYINAANGSETEIYIGKEGDDELYLILDFNQGRFSRGSNWLNVGSVAQGWAGYSSHFGRGGLLGEDTYIPEPSTLVLLGFAGILLLRRRRM